MANVFLSQPKLIGKEATGLSPQPPRRKSRPKVASPSGEDDTEYFGPVGRWALSQLMAVDGKVARIDDCRLWPKNDSFSDCLRVKTVLSISSPTFPRHPDGVLGRKHESLLRELSPALKVVHAALANHGRFSAEVIWPSLPVYLDGWTDGHAARYVGPLRSYFPTTPIQSKGLWPPKAW